MKPDLQPEPIRRSSYPVRQGNDVRVWIDGHDALGRIFQLAANARRSLWVTVSFVHPDVRLPGCDRSFLDFVTELAASGIDVRLLFWWSEYAGIGSYRGDEHELAELRGRDCRAKMRWDAVPRGCHHQKSYVIDGEVAFVGGINLTREAVSSQAHDTEGFHDMFAEIRGPAVTDVARNFVERWNQATVTREHGHAFPSATSADDLSAEDLRSEPSGSTPLQVLRSLRHGLYSGRAGWHASEEFDLAGGEDAIRTAVLDCISRARRSLYIENQFVMDPGTIIALADAADRGVEVITVVPLTPDPNLLLYPADKMQETRKALASLAERENVGLFGLLHENDPARPIYVHSKLLIADDRVLQLGSANLWPPSYIRDSELNVLVWDAGIAHETRRRLWDEHLLGTEATSLDDWRRLASESARARTLASPAPTRLVAVDPAAYYQFERDAVAPWEASSEIAERPAPSG